ncbi:diguanylate cyclase [Marinobacter salinus]|uniref:diguanylate cyclase n=1 Tax=Marinobacter salinus TaxID=1874317 RepID=A0A1D9GPS0_9GAMM|nr:sensor domain-containing diguanylate cyclase [Marinobacter salinus]AOY89400.1 diguanylate cyclase [Marinobacter salinus]
MPLSAETRLKAILDGTGAGTWEYNLDTGDIILNDRWASMLGYSLEELAPISFQTWESLCHPKDLGPANEALASYLNGQGPQFECVFRMMHKDGEWRHIHSRGMLLNNGKNDGTRWLMGTHLDVTEEKTSQHQLEQLAESLPGIIYTFVMEPDGQFHFSYISRKTEDLYGIHSDQAIADPQKMFDVVHPDDLQRVQDSIGLSAESLCEWVCDYRVLVEDRITWVRGVSRPERDTDGRVTWHGVITNINDQKRLELELEHLSITDELTGLFNRRYMLHKLEEAAAENERYGGIFSVISLDIDFFKAINDSWGHPTGDSVLQTIAKLIQQRTRKSDIVARTGGEEFIVLMPNTALADARHVADALRMALAAEDFVSDEGERFTVTLSAGVVSWSDDTASVRDLLSVCDRSLYEAKRAGRNRVAVRGGTNPN